MATPEEMAASMLANVEEKTGRKLDAWIELLRKEGFEKHGQMMKFLKSDHGVTHGFANLIAHQARSQGEPRPQGDDLVEAQYAGGKSGLRPIYDRLIAAAEKFGSDVEVSPKKTYVSLRRKKQFALIKPATKARMDVGIQLKGDAGSDRLVACKANSMTSHQVSVTDAAAVDAELVDWLREAYERAG